MDWLSDDEITMSRHFSAVVNAAKSYQRGQCGSNVIVRLWYVFYGTSPDEVKLTQ